MGNYNLKVKEHPKIGSVARIVHDKFSRDNDIPDEIIGAGEIVKVIRTQDLFKSRPNCPDITVTKVIRKRNGKPDYEAYFTTNLGSVN